MSSRTHAKGSVSVVCPACGAEVPFSPVVEGVEIHSDPPAGMRPFLRVVLQPGNVVFHECVPEA